jgi:hypothetical protein
MEIGPIPGIRAIGALRAERADWQTPAILDIEAGAKPGDGIVQRTGRKAAGAEEEEDDELDLEDRNEAASETPARNIDYFA